MRIFAGVPLGVGVDQTTLGVVDDGYFWQFRWDVFENFRDTASNNICDDMLPLVDRQMNAK